MSQTLEPDLGPKPAERLVALDAFRGLTIAGMILVNNPGDWAHVYPPLGHAAWHGWTPTDLVFPSFLFIVGVAIHLALGKRVRRGDAPSALLAKVLWRAAVIFALGLLLNAFPFDKSPATLRIPGVLQRIALCYLATALLYLFTTARTQAVVTAGLLLGYWAVLTQVPVPGVGAGDLSRPNNLAAWLDRLVMPGHLYKPDYDPEGLLSTLPAVATTLLGVFAGRWVTAGRPAGERVAGLFAAGALAMAAGAAWDAAFPINKALWTSSFVLWSAGLSLQILALCDWLIEVEGVRRWAGPFVVFGSNPILAFVLSGLLARVLTLVKVAGTSGAPVPLKTWIYHQGFTSWADPTFASFLFAASYVLFWLAVLAVFYKAKVFVRV
jgi:predicted acyltransferase